MSFSPGTRFGPYEIAALIGVGGMGEVYRAKDTSLRRDVAIKVLPESFAGARDWLARFQREAEMLAALNHQNIAHVYGLERADATTGLVMELIEGPTLADRIAQGRVPLTEAMPIAIQIADALEAAHERGIVHRDLKPANVKLRADGAVKVLDFGIAKALLPAFNVSGPQTQVANTPTMTQLGMILGTAAYMSPEQARGKPVDKRTDIWAFGCVLYEMLTGQPAFGGEDVTTTLARVLEREVDFAALPADVPPVVRQTLAACLQKDAKKRVRDVGDVKLALEGAFETRVERGSAEPRWRRALALGVAFVAGAAVLALAAWRLWPAPEPRAVTRLAMPITIRLQTPVVTVSPDGRRIGYMGDDRRIYVRDLSEFEARAVSSANASPNAPPCFSPDGDWIAYSEGDALNKAQVSPGAATPVARDLDGADVCFWGDDGYIYFSATPGIMRVREAGGPAEVVAAPSEERGEIRFESPQLLPGGAQLLYSVYGEQGDTTARVDVLTLTTRKRKTVLDGVGVATFVPVARKAPRGYLVYGLNGALFAAPFDSRSLETGGARAVASDVHGIGAWSSAGVSASGTLAYLSVLKLEGNATLVVMDRDGTQHPLPEPRRLYGEVHFSPDGHRVALATNSPTLTSITSTDTWIYELDGGGLTRLPIGGGNYGNVWTPDGRRLIYFHWDLATLPGIAVRGAGAIQSVPADGSGPATTLVAQASWMNGLVLPMSESPDGKTLLVQQNSAPGNADVLALALDEGSPPGASTAAPRPFIATRFNEGQSKFSPDGRFVAYVSDESGQNEVYVVPYPGPGGKSQVSRGGGTLPRWNRNGRELFYLSEDGKLMSVAVETAPAFRADAPRVLFDDPQIMQRPGFPYDVSPDGTRFIVIRADAGDAVVRPQSELRVVVNWIDELERAARPAQH